MVTYRRVQYYDDDDDDNDDDDDDGSLKEPISRIINKSISSGVVPCALEQAVEKPLHKKPSLDKNSLKSYRPV